MRKTTTNEVPIAGMHMRPQAGGMISPDST